MLPSLNRLTVPTGAMWSSRESFERSYLLAQEAEKKWMDALKDNDISTAALREYHQGVILGYEQEVLHDLGVLAERGEREWPAEVWQAKKELIESSIASDRKKRNLILRLLEHPEVNLDTETRQLLQADVQYSIWRRRARRPQLAFDPYDHSHPGLAQ
jgi:uncharacterized protein YbgA (DUF1722 family)